MFQEKWRQRYPKKFASEETIFGRINRGDTIFIGSACAEPQHLVQGLIRFVKSNPKAFVDAQVLHIRSLGVAPTPRKVQTEFPPQLLLYRRQHPGRGQQGGRELYPHLPPEAPGLFSRGLARIDVALIQATSRTSTAS